MQLMEHEAPGGVGEGSLPQYMLGCIFKVLLSYSEKIAHMSVVCVCIFVSLYLCVFVSLYLCVFVCWDVCSQSQ